MAVAHPDLDRTIAEPHLCHGSGIDLPQEIRERKPRRLWCALRDVQGGTAGNEQGAGNDGDQEARPAEAR
jgi:hypothetical protein